MSLLRRKFAPISDRVWEELDGTAKRILTRNLSGRRVVDIDGPHGLEYAARNTGRVKPGTESTSFGVDWGWRESQPLLEIRIPFVLKQEVAKNIERGCRDPELGPLEQAAEQIARFEDMTVLKGFQVGGIRGISDASTHTAVHLPAEAQQYPKAVAEGLKQIAVIGIGGPYALVLGPDEYFNLLQGRGAGYPPHRVIENMTGGGIHFSPGITGGVLLSMRGGDFELTIGQDLSIGYNSHDRENIEFFIFESFTFRALTPEAAIELKAANGGE